MFDSTFGLRPLVLFGLSAAAVTAMALLGTTEAERIARGRELFDTAFRRPTGLGKPDMNADSCRACHSDPVLGGAGALELNVSRAGFDNGGAGPFQDVPGGQILSKLRPPHVTGREEAAALADCFEQRQSPSLLGLGLVDGIPDAAILANEDPTDANGDGIRGVARRLQIQGATEIGRFGWKCQVPTLLDFGRDAMGQELGITTSDDNRGFAIPTDNDEVADPELNDAQLDNLVAFIASLPAPARGGSLDPLVPLGQQVFTEVGCARCHIPSLQGASGPVNLFSNLLLHNVMPAGYRGMAEPGAGVGMFRTPPLWGIKDTAPYMHDGRAETLTAAILAHDGEAAAVRAAFLQRSEADRDALLRFLGDL